MPKFIEIPVFTFAELSDKAKQHAIAKYASDACEIYTDYYVSVLESFGFSDVKVWYSLGYCQSDFASFDTKWRYKKGWKKAHLADFGTQCKYTEFFSQIQAIMKKYFYDFCLTIKTKHEYPEMEYECLNNVFTCQCQSLTIKDEIGLVTALRNIAKQIYCDMMSEYEYLTSEDCFNETCEANEWLFLESGEMLDG